MDYGWSVLILWKLIRFGLILLMIGFISFPSADAWTWKTHSDIVDAVYYALPTEVQKNLDLEIMENASNDPDELFKDFTYHSYPKSYERAKSWLSKGKAAYDRGDYAEASYDYGVASHYISDTFSAAHSVSKEESEDHIQYENQAKSLVPMPNYQSRDLNIMLQNGYKQGSISWDEWLQTKNSAVVQKNLNDGASAALSAIKDSINIKNTSQPNTNNNQTKNEPIKTPQSTNSVPWTTYLLIILVVMVIIGITGYIFLVR